MWPDAVRALSQLLSSIEREIRRRQFVVTFRFQYRLILKILAQVIGLFMPYPFLGSDVKSSAGNSKLRPSGTAVAASGDAAADVFAGTTRRPGKTPEFEVWRKLQKITIVSAVRRWRRESPVSSGRSSGLRRCRCGAESGSPRESSHHGRSKWWSAAPGS